MKQKWSLKKWLQIILVLIGIHSFFVGLALMVLPADVITLFGFTGYEDNFFRAQGGVFHFVLIAAYIMPVIRWDAYKNIIWYAIIAKLIATLFLISCYIFAYPVITILLSGVADFLMALVLWILFHQYNNGNKNTWEENWKA